MTFEFLFTILGFHIPSFLQLILPLAFFLSLLLAYGRLYIENEMSILFSSGISKLKLTGYTLGIAMAVTLINALLTLWITPASEYRVEQAYQDQNQLTVFDFIQPGRFQGNGQATTYVSSFTAEEGWMNEVFISDSTVKKGETIPVQTLAAYAEQIKVEAEGGLTYLVLKDGTRLEGIPGRKDFRVSQFETYAIRLEAPAESEITDLYTLPTANIWRSNDIQEMAEWHWRLALIVMIPILAIIGISLSQVNPRQGRFFKMLPAILLMIAYIGLVIWGRTALEKQQTPIEWGLWWVHLLFAAIALSLFMRFNDLSLYFKRRFA